ncbi:Phospholipase D1 [Golovinomyces cichoracearum]|uniref:Phospholipase n=1 Tax=Golovinomyces cichoracearum TaxID=62708 RepID=A0A420IRR8_9PEZI|nr:Phospholipase D1 [Golovinomyces cichoracearum]
MSFFKDIKSNLDHFADDLKKPLHDIREKLEQGLGHSHADDNANVQDVQNLHKNRFHSFAPSREHNNAKWYVDGCGYMWAVSVAIMEARESIWIMDWWLSPEIYLRRPPSNNEDYRLDRMLLAAADRGVKVNIIVYKEVAAALTLSSKHTKAALELHPNIAVFRHPDHKPVGLQSEIAATLNSLSLGHREIGEIPGEALKSIYGVHQDIVLFWAHHEKLCLIDRKIAFMGGLDLCFGRWDTNDHPIADAHPNNVRDILFPGQDFNNARVKDFEDVENFMNNKLDRNKNSRMGWTDVSLSLTGPVVDDLGAHFVQRWNYIFNQKYKARRDPRYTALTFEPQQIPENQYNPDGSNSNSNSDSTDGSHNRAVDDQGFHLDSSSSEMFNRFRGRFPVLRKQLNTSHSESSGSVAVQLVRSCCDWSHGVPTECSINSAYINVIKESQHYVYIENQFFITATDDDQRPVRNKIGEAIVERVVRAHNEGQNYKIIVVIPSVPAFAGDLSADSSIGTRAIMEFQYHSICRNGHSILEKIEKAGVPDPSRYIRFYNLRNFDRINAGTVSEEIGRQGDLNCNENEIPNRGTCGNGYNPQCRENNKISGFPGQSYDCYQQGEINVRGESNYDSVSSCYMDNSLPITKIPWNGSSEAEFDAFVSEELYIHSKLLIADDRIVICGSANLNDRSQLGDHDSEIAVVIEDPTPVDSLMDGKSYQASYFATSLRRQIFRKHLGLIPAQNPRHATANFLPVDKSPNEYDWNSPNDRIVSDPLGENFWKLWNNTAQINTEVFSRAFHVVPSDNCRNWDQYKEWYGRFFLSPSEELKKEKTPPKYQYGHLVKEEFPGGVEEAKQWLSRIRGTLVEMPLNFMNKVDFAVAGVMLNAITSEIYT